MTEPTPSSMVERVARALAADVVSGVDEPEWVAKYINDSWPGYADSARIAIEAAGYAELVEALRECVQALKPFADVMVGREDWQDAGEIDLPVSRGVNYARARLRISEFRKARAAITRAGGGL